MAKQAGKDELDAMMERIRNFMTPNGMDWDIISDLKDPKNERLVIQNCWEFLIVVVECVNSTEESNKPDIVTKGENILNRLALSGNPKEMIMGLLEQMGTVEDPVTTFRLFARPLQSSLQRISSKKNESLYEVLGTLCRRLQDLAVPKNHGYSEKELLLLDLDPDVKNLEVVTQELKVFLAPFVKEHGANKDLKAQRRLAGYVMKVLDNPLFHADLSNSGGKAVGMLRACAETMVTYLKVLEENFFSFGERVIETDAAVATEPSNDEVEGRVSIRSIATLFYLVISEGICKDHLPWVIGANRLTEFSIPLITVLVTANEECAVHKGLSLAEVLLDAIPDGELTEDNAQMDNYYDVLRGFVKVAITCGVEDSRKKSVNLIRRLVRKFADRTRFFVLKGMLMTNSHSGVLSLVIGTLKDCVAKWVAARDVPPWFQSGRHMAAILKQAMDIPDGVETDIQENWDRIMGALNLLRYLFLSDDRAVNVTGVWDLLDEVREFVAVLQKAVQISRAHYQLELDNKKLELGSGKKAKGDGIFDVPGMDVEVQMRILNNTVTSFDLMDSVLVRLTEIIDQKNKV